MDGCLDERVDEKTNRRKEGWTDGSLEVRMTDYETDGRSK